MTPTALDELAPLEEPERSVGGAFGKTGGFGNATQARTDPPPSIACRFAVQMEIDEVGSRLAIVPDQVAHQYVDGVVVDWDGLMEARHVAA